MENRKNNSGKIKLFTIPYAGGTAFVYNKWKDFLHSGIEMCAIELSGHGLRIKEALYNSFGEAVEDICKIVINQKGNDDYAIFGHSMGGLLTYEVIHRLMEFGIQQPQHIFFSGINPPFASRPYKSLYKLSDEEFIKEIFSYGGTPKELLVHEKLMKLFLPILRSDYRIFELYEYKTGRKLFDCDITVLSGKEDPLIEYDQIDSWQECTTGYSKSFIFNGGHFFINEHTREIVNIINTALVN